MNKKGQKLTTYSNDFIKEVVAYAEKHSFGQTAEHYKIPRGTVGTWVRRMRLCGFTDKKAQGRKLMQGMTDREKYEFIKKFHDFYKSSGMID